MKENKIHAYHQANVAACGRRTTKPLVFVSDKVPGSVEGFLNADNTCEQCRLRVRQKLKKR